MSTQTKPRSLRDTLPLPPLLNMSELDRSAFTQKIHFISARIKLPQVSELKTHPALRPYLFDLPKYPGIVVDPGSASQRLLRFRVQNESDLSSEARELLAKKADGIVPEELEIGYDFWHTSEVLRSILPPGVDEEVPSSFTQVGHIAHINLRDEWLPYRKLIGQVLLDKNPSVRTVVNKVGEIHAEYRFFDMEVIAGEHEFITTAHESGCAFQLDFSKVYWNSRLGHEHERLIQSLRVGEVVADAMAGVGPFAIPAAKKGCYVLGNDLNPDAVQWMRANRVNNKVEGTLRVSEMDGREFIRQSPHMAWDEPFQPFVPKLTRGELKARRKAREESRSQVSTPSVVQGRAPSANGVNDPTGDHQRGKRPQMVDHYIMNLPDSALTFLDAYIGLYSPFQTNQAFMDRLQTEEQSLPMIHVYCFTRFLDQAEAERDIQTRASERIGHAILSDMDGYHLHWVRSVAPHKEMYCLSFRLPHAVAFAPLPSSTS